MPQLRLELYIRPRITVITIGVDDLEESLRFYRDGLGFATDDPIGEEFEHGAVLSIQLQAGLRPALWSRQSIAHDTGLPQSEPSPTEFTLGHNVSSKAEIDEIMKQAANAGAVIVNPAHDTFWGSYAGYFQDPDGHLWEVAWNPRWADPEWCQIAGYQAQPVVPDEFDVLEDKQPWGEP